MSENRCPSCQRELPVADGAFCPYCGAALEKGDELPETVRAALEAAWKENDPVKKHRMLTEARQAFPNCLPIEEELLFLGRLYERDGKNPTFDVIKCFLLHPYLTPKEFSTAKRDAMREELFHHEQLERCKALATDPDVFVSRYLERLSEKFIRLFLEGSTYYMRSFFGFTSRKNAPRLLAEPTARMIGNMTADKALSSEERRMLTHAFYRGFSRRMNGQTEWLRQELERQGILMED